MLPLSQAFLHFPGIGPARLRLLHAAGVREWKDVRQTPPSVEGFPKCLWNDIYLAACQNIKANEDNDIDFFVQHLKVEDRWRLIHKFWDRCTFLDIETDGLERDAQITVISCWNGHSVKWFVQGENLDDFPDFLLNAPFLITYNGSTFDLPVIRQYFNLPEINVPHVDLRWICHRCQLDGGLKQIERHLGLRRPDDLIETNGTEAIYLWNLWNDEHNADAKAKLLRYCAADTIALQHVTANILAEQSGDSPSFGIAADCHWALLDKILPPPQADAIPPPPNGMFGQPRGNDRNGIEAAPANAEHPGPFLVQTTESAQTAYTPQASHTANADSEPSQDDIMQRLRQFLDRKRNR